MAAHEARPTKLVDGSWGAKILGAEVKVGDELTIRSLNGKTWTTKVASIVWNGVGATVVATENNRISSVAKGGKIWEECPNCGFEPIYLPLSLCERCWPK